MESRTDTGNRTLTVPFGLFHISFRLNSSTRASSGVIVAHLMPTLYLRIALAASIVTWSFVYANSKLAHDGTLNLEQSSPDLDIPVPDQSI